MNILLRNFQSSNNTAEEPSLKVGSLTATVAGALSLITVFFPDLMSEKTITVILVVAAFVLPLITAIFTRGKVWSPASVQALVDAAVADATEKLKERLEIQRKISEKKTNTD